VAQARVIRLALPEGTLLAAVQLNQLTQVGQHS